MMPLHNPRIYHDPMPTAPNGQTTVISTLEFPSTSNPVRVHFEHTDPPHDVDSNPNMYNGVGIYIDTYATPETITPVHGCASLTKTCRTFSRPVAREIWNGLVEMGFRAI